MDSLKILAIGNSFSDDGTWYLWDMLNSVGIKEVVIGNLYIGGCSLDTHYDNVTLPERAETQMYIYHKNTSGEWVDTPGRIETALADEDWDIVTFQQTSGQSGLPEYYGKLNALVEFVRQRVNKSCKFYWHMTWAYPQSSTHPAFSRYGSDQIQMYRAITDTVQNTVLKNPEFAGVIPSGTAIQNIRSSYLGDTLNRDGFHLSHSHGRFAAALTWACALTDVQPEKVTWRLTNEYAFPEKDVVSICEGVRNAIRNMYAVTESE